MMEIGFEMDPDEISAAGPSCLQSICSGNICTSASNWSHEFWNTQDDWWKATFPGLVRFLHGIGLFAALPGSHPLGPARFLDAFLLGGAIAVYITVVVMHAQPLVAV